MVRSRKKKHPSKKGRSSAIYDSIILSLSVYVILQLAVEVISELPPKVTTILEYADLAVCIIFIADWIYSFFRASDKWDFTKKRLIDLVASIPLLQILRPFRIIRIVRLARALRLARGAKGLIPLLAWATNNKSRSALTIYGAVTLVIYVYCSIGIYNFEKGSNELIHGFGDVLWMAFTTLTTVGYGDLYPKTTGGRVMAAVLILTGLGLFGLVTAEFAAFLLRRVSRPERRK